MPHLEIMLSNICYIITVFHSKIILYDICSVLEIYDLIFLSTLFSRGNFKDITYLPKSVELWN